MTCTTPYQGDVYEITYSKEGVTSILLYRRGELAKGEEVDFDSLQPALQERIFNKLREALLEDERDSNSTHSKENGSQ